MSLESDEREEINRLTSSVNNFVINGGYTETANKVYKECYNKIKEKYRLMWQGRSRVCTEPYTNQYKINMGVEPINRESEEVKKDKLALNHCSKFLYERR